MTGFIISLLIAGYLTPGILWRISLLRTSNGYRPGLTSAVACVMLWPLIGAAELNEWVKERMA